MDESLEIFNEIRNRMKLWLKIVGEDDPKGLRRPGLIFKGISHGFYSETKVEHYYEHIYITKTAERNESIYVVCACL